MTYKSILYAFFAGFSTLLAASFIAAVSFPDGAPKAALIVGGASAYYAAKSGYKAGKKKQFINKEIEGLEPEEVEILEREEAAQ